MDLIRLMRADLSIFFTYGSASSLESVLQLEWVYLKVFLQHCLIQDLVKESGSIYPAGSRQDLLKTILLLIILVSIR